MNEADLIMNHRLDGMATIGLPLFHAATPEEARKKMEEAIAAQVAAYQAMEFSAHKKEIAHLSAEKKMQWYVAQNPHVLISLGNNPEFQRFWKWRVLMPMKLKRFYYRLKNGELWKHYAHITDTPELRQKKRPTGPERI